jgi:ABC-type dipeptide/oligopeptide/nickel transport system permease component
VRTARAKGVSGKMVLMRHALRNALIPFVTLSGLSIALLLEGAVIVETVFSWPGLGSWLIEAIKGRDAPVTMAAVLMIAVIYTLINLLVDLLYVVIDPRVRLEGGAGR